MPNRFLTLTILVAWLATTSMLLRRDVLPSLLVGPPPDLRSVIALQPGASDSAAWDILIEETGDGSLLHPVGEIQTRTTRSKDGWLSLSSHAWFDSRELTRGTPLEVKQSERLEIRSLFAIEPSGNLENFRIGVSLGRAPLEILILDGKVVGDDLLVAAHGPVPLLNWKKRFPYQPHSMVQSAMGPMGVLPGLQIGQRWESRMISPLTAAVEQVSVTVERRSIITWDDNPVTTYEVRTRSGPLSALSWVRMDGLVLRQEVPFPFARLILERQGSSQKSSMPEPTEP